jgi:hypothetical protein
MTGSARCCARATIGPTATVLPSPAMKSRRLIICESPPRWPQRYRDFDYLYPRSESRRSSKRILACGSVPT